MSQTKKEKVLKTNEKRATRQRFVFLAFFHESCEIDVMAGLLARGPTYCLPVHDAGQWL
jgi:hypothetical protein